jgi:Flp pilus assembly protein CpaB
MKGAPGLLFAIGLGIVGAFCNWLYLANKGKELDMVDFIAIAEDVKINPGDKFNDSQFMKLSIPQNAVGNLDKVAVFWKDRATVVGEPATKSYSPGEILLQRQIRTPPEMDIKKLLLPDERLLWIPVDTRTFVPSLVNAGDQVSFIVPRMTPVAPAAEDDENAEKKSTAATELIGPFRILALGNRLGSQEVLRAAGVTPSQENVMAVAVKMVGKEFDENGQKILDNLRLTNFQQVQVVLHPAPEAGKGK